MDTSFLEEERRLSNQVEIKGTFSPGFRHQMVELVRAGRSLESVTKEFDPSRQDNPQLGVPVRTR